MNVGSLSLDMSLNMSRIQAALRTTVDRVRDLGHEMERAFGSEPQNQIDQTERRLQRFTWAARGYLKDATKIASGILISQGFYEMLNTIESAISSVATFNNQLQQAAISFKYLLGTKEDANAYIQLLQDFAANTPFNYADAQKLSQQLMAYGIPSTRPFMTSYVEEAVSVAREMKYPVVIKVISPDIPDRVDVGGVITGINSDEQLAEAYGRMMKEVRERAPRAVIEGVTIQEMVEAIDYELILGSKRDTDFGSVILFGMGGITSDLIRDFSIGLPPLNQTLARRLMEETKAYRLIQGHKGKTPANLREIENILVSFSNMIADFPEIVEIDINPLAISHGMPCALDARIVLEAEPSDHTSPYSHLVITPYPESLTTNWTLPDGTAVVLRAIRPEDEALERELLESLSPETIQKRLFSSLGEVTHERLVTFCNIDYDRQVAIIAEITTGDRRRIIGVARFFVDPDRNSCKFALVIHDEFQGRGLGYGLMQVLIEIARKKGLHEITGEVLTENRVMLGLMRKLGFTRQWVPGGLTDVRLSLE